MRTKNEATPSDNLDSRKSWAWTVKKQGEVENNWGGQVQFHFRPGCPGKKVLMSIQVPLDDNVHLRTTYLLLARAVIPT